MDNNPSYHHGNLEQALIRAATAMISETGVEQLTMRALAQRIGVSRTAAYHHFKNKNELLCAIAEQGFGLWQARFDPLLASRPQPLAPWLERFIQTYMAFARDHGEQYDLMFGRPIWKSGTPTASLRTLSAEVFQQYVHFIRHWQQQGLFSPELDGLRLAQVSWGMLHGLSRLLNDGVYLDGEALEGMREAMVRLLLACYHA